MLRNGKHLPLPHSPPGCVGVHVRAHIGTYVGFLHVFAFACAPFFSFVCGERRGGKVVVMGGLLCIFCMPFVCIFTHTHTHTPVRCERACLCIALTGPVCWQLKKKKEPPVARCTLIMFLS